MSIFAISDLHLSLSADKPMDVFGPSWHGYMDRIKENWKCTVKDNDTVLIPGDISWAMRITDAKEDFLFLDSLPGKKIIGKGNHDYWWSSLKKITEVFDLWSVSSIDILHNNSYEVDDFVICGSRGWKNPDSPDANEQDRKIYARELNRLAISLESVSHKGKKIICGLHYPPFGPSGEESEITQILKKYEIHTCVYGHIHKNFESCGVVRGMANGIRYELISSDYLKFMPLNISY